MKDLNKQIITQMNIIVDLRHNMSLIHDISNDTKKLGKKQMETKIKEFIQIEESDTN